MMRILQPYIDFTLESVQVIVMCVFETHTFKEISRSQLASAANFLR